MSETSTPTGFPRDEIIRREFEKLGGGLSSRIFAQHLITSGVFEEEWLEDAAIAKVQTEIRRVLKAPDKAGIPFAAAIGRGASAVWKQLGFMDYPEMAQVIADLAQDVSHDYSQLVKVRDFCQSRFGRAPEIPDLIDPPSWRHSAAD